jgi:hypothetical protein
VLVSELPSASLAWGGGERLKGSYEVIIMIGTHSNWSVIIKDVTDLMLRIFAGFGRSAWIHCLDSFK